MIRPFDWRDLALLHRMRSHGLCLDSLLDYTRGPDAFLDALLDPFSPNRSTCTLIFRPDNDDQQPAVGQFTHRAQRPFAHLTFLGPVEALSQNGSLRLIEALSQAAGEQLVHHLIAEVDEECLAFEILRRAGFAVYARQRIWRLIKPPAEAAQALASAWRFESPADDSAIRGLYHNLVPGLVQQVEAPPETSSRNLVHWDDDELLGFLDIMRGARGVWAQAYFHPAVERVDDLLAAALVHFNPVMKIPLFVCVRSYQAGLSGSLQHLGFEPCASQAVMVKRLTAAMRRPVVSSIPAMDGTQPEPTAPFTHLPAYARGEREFPVRELS